MKSGTTGTALDEALKTLSAAKTNQAAVGARTAPELADLGAQAVGAFTLSVGTGHSRVEALSAESAALSALEQEYKDLGLTVDDVALKELFAQNDVLKATGSLQAGIDGVTKQMVGLDNINLETADSFAAQQRTAAAMYTRLQAAVDATAKANGDLSDQTKQALLPMQDYLHQAEIEAEKLGVPLDAITQQMIDQSKEAGIWQEGLTPKPTVQDAIQTLADTVDDLARALRGLPPNVHTHVTVDTTTTTSTGGPPENIPVQPGSTFPEVPQVYSRGGMVRYFATGWTPKGTDTVPAMLTPGESVLTKAATEALGWQTINALNTGTSAFLKGDERFMAPDIWGTVTHDAVMSGAPSTPTATSVVQTARESGIGNGDLTVLFKMDGKIMTQAVIEDFRTNRAGAKSDALGALGQRVTTWAQ